MSPLVLLRLHQPVESFWIRLGKFIKSSLLAFTHSIQPKDCVRDSVARLAQIDANTHSGVGDVATMKGSSEQVSELATATQLVDIGLCFLVSVELQSALELQTCRLTKVILELLIEELSN